MRKPRLNPYLSALPATVPFVGPETQERRRGRPFRARLGANESAFGPSPRAVEAMRESAAENWKYSDPENYELRDAVARFHDVRIDNVVIGEGIDGLLGHAVHLALEPGSAVITSDGAYPTFNFHVAAHAGRLVRVPFRNDREDLDELRAAAVREDARIVYVSNPDSPMGSCWNGPELEAFIAAIPDGALLLLDEAYCDTAPAGAVPPVDVSNPQVLRFRTFSKAYGLAGARIGYCLGEAGLIAGFEKVRNHYGINRVGQVGALAALQDQDYLRTAVARIARARARIAAIATANGLAPLPSATNFVAVDCLAGAGFARRLLGELLERDVFVRMPAAAPLDRCIRISCGLDADLDFLAAVLPDAIAAARRG